MEQHRIQVVLEADQPIKHLAESFGNSAILNTRKMRQRDGTFARVPELSGDAMRHGLRESIAYVQLHATGGTDRPQLSEAALRLLFAGGMVTGRGDNQSVRLGEYRKMVELMPHLALLGGCAENRTIPGRIDVDAATLVCAESERYLSPWARGVEGVREAASATYRESIEEVQRVRMDPSLSPAKRALLEPAEADKIERRLTASETASRDGDDAAKDAAKSSMMPRRFERIAQGALFTWSVSATLFDALDADTFYTMFCAFAGSMVVGGGRSVGHGKLKVVAARREILRSASEVPTAEEVGLVSLSEGVGNLYLAHVKARGPALVDYLRTVNA